jgi:hypothetical protein
LTHVQSSSTGFVMAERSSPKAVRAPHNFIPVEQYLRERPVTVSLADAFAWHAAAESKRPVRCIADMLGAHMTPRNRTNPLLRKRQTMDAIV